MVSIRLRLEIPAPSTKLMEPLPEGARELVITTVSEVIARCIVEVDIDGQAYDVHRTQRTNTPLGVGLRLLGTTKDFSEATTVALFVDMIQQKGKEPSE